MTQPATTRERELLQRVNALEQILAKAERLAVTDPLTSILNRRGWERALQEEEDRCQRHGLDAIVLMVDLDQLKAVNDTRGHHAGDEMLRRCAAALKSGLRSHDRLARVGGDEFGIVAVQVEGIVVQLLRRRIENALGRARVAATVGAQARSATGSLEAAWRAADDEMVAAKGHAHRRYTRDRAR